MINNLSLFSSSRSTSCAFVYTLSNRSYSQDFKTIPELNLSSLKRGTGGRSSFNGNVVTVFGATGFLGRQICNQLGKRGTQIIVPYRSDFDSTPLKSLKLAGDLGQVLFQPFDLRDPISIHKAIKYSNIVINVMGRFNETRNFDHYALHFKGAKEIAKACREQKVDKLIHFSALNANENPKKYIMKSKFLSMKFQGENAVLNEFPDAIIFRPSLIFGARDKFLWALLEPIRRSFGALPLYAKGLKTTKQVVFCKDVVNGVINAINDSNWKGKIIQAVGPECFYLHDLTNFCAQITQLQRNEKQSIIFDLRYDPTLIMKHIVLNKIVLSLQDNIVHALLPEYLELESTPDYVDRDLPTLKDLGVPLTKFEDVVPHIILPFFLQRKYFFRDVEDYVAADSLANKVVNEYSL